MEKLLIITLCFLIVDGTADWYQQLSPAQKVIVKNIAQKLIDKINGLDIKDVTISYSLKNSRLQTGACAWADSTVKSSLAIQNGIRVFWRPPVIAGFHQLPMEVVTMNLFIRSNMRHSNKYWSHLLFLVFGLLSSFVALAQQTKKHISLKDSADHAMDLSDYIIDANGFVPIPYIITEPALGGFGGLLAPVFIKKRPPYVDSVNGKLQITPIAPDITGGVAAYTLNDTWILGLFRSGTLVKSRIKYTIGGGYANVNMSFYHTFPTVGEKEFKFNFRTLPAMLQVTKRIAYSHWYIGLKYLFLKTDLHYEGELPSFVKPIEKSSIVSQLGAVVELDNRDNVFTPDRGIKFHFDAINSGNYFGSDYSFWHSNYYAYLYTPISKKLIGGWRIDGQQTFGSPPFYLLPYIDMRGVPTARYQGKADILTELEGRWDFVRRWSIVLFSGTGKAFDDWSDFGSAKWVISYGTGFRYLLARKFGLRMGIDLAHGPDTWAYYIVFGSNWLK